jgi:hypothetical protein
MRCDYGISSRNHCQSEAVGQITDQFSSNVYCKTHLEQFEEGFKIAHRSECAQTSKIEWFKK